MSLLIDFSHLWLCVCVREDPHYATNLLPLCCAHTHIGWTLLCIGTIRVLIPAALIYRSHLHNKGLLCNIERSGISLGAIIIQAYSAFPGWDSIKFHFQCNYCDM